ncbi:helix-turn-helix domain-containing protein [Streptomyces sp. NPDC091377]|uniref:helix-turn-helix domain-containing protein n=1 Tax=Streptomyces sp. NPDC091377 TaxID=3365995 RepID=UPI0037F664E3
MTQSPATPLPPPKECRRLREAAALTQAQLASQVGVTRETVRAWENGRTTPRGRKRDAYAKLLARLAGDTAKPTSTPSPAAATAGAGATSGGAGTGAGAGAVASAVTTAAAAADGVSAGGTSDDPKPSTPTPNTQTLNTQTPNTSPSSSGTPTVGTPGVGAPTLGASNAGASSVGASSVGASVGGTSNTYVTARQEPLRMQVRQAPPRPAATQTVTVIAAPVAADPGEEPALRDQTPGEAFDALYTFCAPALVRQAYLLCGRRELARESVERAFQQAWGRWPEVALDRDPAGWVRAAAYEYALSPWHRYRPRYRHPEPPPADAQDRALLSTLLRLPTPYRRTLLLYDGVGLGLADTAAETEASTPAAANRLMHAREAVAERLPDLSDPSVLHDRLTQLASNERLRAPRPPVVRAESERRARFWTRAAVAFTVALIGATALTLKTAPTQYEPPVSPGETVRGVPPKSAPGPLSEEQVELRRKLREALAAGPERLTPQAG